MTEEKMYDMAEIAGERLQKMIEGTELYLDDMYTAEDFFQISIYKPRKDYFGKHIADFKFEYRDDEELYGSIEEQLEDSLNRFENWFGRD